MTKEIWQQIPGWLHYEASSLGRIRSVGRWRPHNRYPGKLMWWKGRILKPVSNRRQAFYVVMPGQKCVLVHKLIAATFIGPCPPGMLVRHLNDIPSDNRPGNLAYGTQLDNMVDAARNNRIPRREQRPNWKGGTHAKAIQLELDEA